MRPETNAPRITQAEIEAILEMRRKGMTWREIEQRVGRLASTLTVTIWRYNKGWRPIRGAAPVEAMIEAYTAGAACKQIAHRFGYQLRSVYRIFAKAGFDAEVRREYRATR